MGNFIGAIDQGTTSTRFIVFDHNANIVASDQKEHRQIYPSPGWVEHDAIGNMGKYPGSNCQCHAEIWSQIRRPRSIGNYQSA